jgi:hypothetical protein
MRLRRVPGPLAFVVGVTVAATAGLLVALPAEAAPSGNHRSSADDVRPMASFGIGTVSPDGNGNLIWRLRDSAHDLPAQYTFTFGVAGDFPVVGDFDGSGGDGIGIVRPSGDRWEWHLRNGVAGGAVFRIRYGSVGTTPIIGNWDGKGGDGPGTVTAGLISGQWQLRDSFTEGDHQYDYYYNPLENRGRVVAGNWDGEGGDGPGMAEYTATQTIWKLREGRGPGGADRNFAYGTESGCPVTGNWDGKGGDGVGVVYRRPGNLLNWQLRDPAGPGNPNYNFNYGSAF